jgi:hypothetical protein
MLYDGFDHAVSFFLCTFAATFRRSALKVNPISFIPLQKKFRQGFEGDGAAFENL